MTTPKPAPPTATELSAWAAMRTAARMLVEAWRWAQEQENLRGQH